MIKLKQILLGITFFVVFDSALLGMQVAPLPYHHFINPYTHLPVALSPRAAELESEAYLAQRDLQKNFMRIPGEEASTETDTSALNFSFDGFMQWWYQGKQPNSYIQNAFKYYYEKNNPFLQPSKNVQTSGGYRIPKIIHQIWVGPKSREKYEKLRQTWLKHHPGWLYKLWTDEDLKNLKLLNRARYDATRNYAEKADYLRYEVLYLFGGVYADIDSVCVKPLDILNKTYDFYIGMCDAEMVNNAFIAATPGHPILKYCIANIGSDPRGMPYSTGPIHITRSFLLVAPLCTEPVIALPYTYFAPLGNGLNASQERINACIRPETFAIHFFAADWY